MAATSQEMDIGKHQDCTACAVKDTTVEYKNMDIEEGQTQWWKEDNSSKRANSTSRWSSKACAIVLTTVPLFLILLTIVSLKFSQQDSMLRELESKTDQVASSIHSLPAKLQQSATPSQEIDNELPEVKSAMTNLGASMTRLSSELNSAVSLHDQRLQGLEAAVKNMSSSLDMIPSQLQQTVGQNGQRLQRLETAVNGISTSVGSKLQLSDEKLMTALANLTVEIFSIKQHKGTPKYRCQNNWIGKGSSCYLFSSNKLAWHAARDYCRTQGGLLLILNNAEEWTFITTNSVPEFYWVGLTDEINEVWRWVDGTPLEMDESQWEPGQPDNWTKHGRGGGEDCAALQALAKLNDGHCSEPRKYICEKAATED